MTSGGMMKFATGISHAPIAIPGEKLACPRRASCTRYNQTSSMTPITTDSALYT